MLYTVCSTVQSMFFIFFTLFIIRFNFLLRNKKNSLYFSLRILTSISILTLLKHHNFYRIQTLLFHLHSYVYVWPYCKILILLLFYYIHLVNEPGQGGCCYTYNVSLATPLLNMYDV